MISSGSRRMTSGWRGEDVVERDLRRKIRVGRYDRCRIIPLDMSLILDIGATHLPPVPTNPDLTFPSTLSASRFATTVVITSQPLLP
jgi:hypothetical protein